MDGLFIGLMTGTSIDGIDAALIEFSGTQQTLVTTDYQPYSTEFRNQLIDVAEARNDSVSEVAKLDVILGEKLAQSALSVIQQSIYVVEDVQAIGSHGQTIRHNIDDPPPFTVQIGDPNIISARTGITTIADFRRKDIAEGGQGAPLAPAFHADIFTAKDEARVILNLGGIANITVLPAGQNGDVIGFDTGPANGLMDAWIHRVKNQSYDANGTWAATGKINQDLLKRLISDDYFHQPSPKSTGRERFNIDWIDQHLVVNSDLPAADVQATLCELTCLSVSQAIQMAAPDTQRLIVCGGGANNHYLLNRLTQHLDGIPVETSSAYGLHPDWIEAAAFAWLARRRLLDLPGNLPSVTGAKKSLVLGAIYPGN